jgi:hypothetical protein
MVALLVSRNFGQNFRMLLIDYINPVGDFVNRSEASATKSCFRIDTVLPKNEPRP